MISYSPSANLLSPKAGAKVKPPFFPPPCVTNGLPFFFSSPFCSFNQVRLTHTMIVMLGHMTEGVFSWNFWAAAAAAGAVLVVVCQGDMHEKCVCECVSEWDGVRNPLWTHKTQRSPKSDLSNWKALAFSSFSHHNGNKHLSCHCKTCATHLIDSGVGGEGRGEGRGRDWWSVDVPNGPDGWDLMYYSWVTSPWRGVGLQHAVVHADRSCASVRTCDGGREQVFFLFFEKQGRARLWQVAADGDGPGGGGGGGWRLFECARGVFFFFKRRACSQHREIDGWLSLVHLPGSADWTGPGGGGRHYRCVIVALHTIVARCSLIEVLSQPFLYLSWAHFVAGRRN